jgi:hypothetical protein
MFWAGRVNAVLAIVAFGGLVLFWALGGPVVALGWLFVMLGVRIAIRILDVVWTALTGNPLIYQTKVLPPRGGDDGQA